MPFQRPVYSHLDTTRPLLVRTRWYSFFNENRQVVKFKDSIQQPDREKLISSGFTAFVHSATLCFNQWVALYVKRDEHLSLKRTSYVAVRWEGPMNWHEFLYREKASLPLKRESVCDGDCRKTAKNLKFLSKKASVTDVHLQLSINKQRKGAENCKCLAGFNAKLKYLENWDPTLISFHACSRKFDSVGIIKLTWRKSILALRYKTVHWSLFAFCFVLKWVLSVQKNTVLLNTFRKNISKVLYSQR